LLHGGSFAHSIEYFLEQHGVADVARTWYNDMGVTGYNPWTEGPEAWKYILEDRDLIIFEATEQQIRGAHKTDNMTWLEAGTPSGLVYHPEIGHNAVYDSLYEYLKAHEGEY
jgi:hypothetical protein